MNTKRVLNSKNLNRYDLDIAFGNILGDQNEKVEYIEEIEEDVFEDSKNEDYAII